MTAAQLTAQFLDLPLRWSGRELRGAAIKGAVTIALLTLLAMHLDTASLYGRLSAIDGRTLALAGLVLALQYALACGRWFYILRRLEVPVGRRQAVSIYGAGALANMLLLVSIAGMSVRGVLLMRGGSDLSRTVAALAVERFAALVGLALCFALALLPGWRLAEPLFGAMNAPGLVLWGAGLAAAAVTAGLLFIRLAPAHGFLRDLGRAFASRRDAALLALSSVAVIYLGFAGIAALASGMGIAVSLVDLMIVLPLVAFAAALPVSLGGWGVREGAMVGSLTLFHVPADAAFALSVTYGLLGIAVVALLGGASALLGLTARDGFRQGPAGLPNAGPRRD